ncbi:MAG: bifunctional riboflavin kinase/FAD synthetase [Beijerinckiaceae bacterium]|nr:bifunctional riboflavin kinase/FAD synthetase [Beijerinckiaceae bacterium]
MPERLSRPVLAIGNFDGLHRGHRAVTEAALAMGRTLGRPVVLLTFEPHPRAFFRPDVPLFRLTDTAAKTRLAERLGLDGMIVLNFDRALASESAVAFITDILIGRLGLTGAVVGFDFQFGARRAGTPQSLAEAGARLGFSVEIVPEQKEGGEGISSTLIRTKLGEGDIAEANRLLGYTWFIVGEVIHGRKVGRTIGYPTANIRLRDDCGLKHGIYAVWLTLAGRRLPGVASFGRRPTFDNGAPLLEVFVFDFNGDLYGETMEVAFVGFIRGEEKFDSVEALVARMDRDSEAARALLERSAR